MSKYLFVLCLFCSLQSSAQKILDAGQLTATSSAAYSVRQLKTTYSHTAITPPATVVGFTNSSTPLIRVRRSSDNGQLDIGYLASGDLDTVTLKSFVGSGSGFVSVWYDQSGFSRDVTQTTTANQPRIVNAGVVERSTSGKLSIRFVRDGGNTYAGSNNLTLSVRADSLFSNGLNGSALSVFEASSGNASAWGMGNGNDRWQIHANEGGGLKFDYGNSYVRTSYENSANQGVMKNYAFIAPVGGGGQIWINGILVSTGAVPASPCTGTLFEIGGIASFNNWNFDNRQAELILFKTALSTNDRTKAGDDQGAYFLDLYVWTGATSTDYAVAANWKTNVLPTVTSDIYVPLSATNPMTISNIYQVNNVTVETGATVTLASGGDLRVSGNVNYGGSFSGPGTLTLNGTSQQSLLGSSGGYGNITINNAAGVAMPVTATINGTLNIVSGQFDIGNTTSNPTVVNTVTFNGNVTGSSSTNSLKASNQTNIVWGNTASGTLFFDAASNNLANLTVSSSGVLTLGSNLNIVEDVTIASGATLNLQTFTLNRTAAGGVLTINGTLKLGANTGGQTGSNYPTNFTTPPTMGTNGVVEYTGSNAISQVVFATTYRNLMLTNGSGSGNADKTSTANFTVQGTFTVNALTTFTPAAANIITGTSATVTGSGTLVANRTTATADFNTQYAFTTRTLTGLTVNYAGGAAQTINNTNTYGNLIVSGGAFTKTLGGVIDVNGDITISGSATLATANNQINIAGNWSNSGTFTPGTGSVVFDGTAQQIGGTTNPSTFNTITINNGSTVTLAQNITVVSNINVNSGGVFDLSTFTANRTAGGGTLTVAGTMKLGAASGGQTGSNFPSNFTTITLSSGTVEYNGAFTITQTIFATPTYNNLVLTNGSNDGTALKISTGNLTINSGNFLVNSGVQFTPPAANTIGGTGTLTGTGAIDVTIATGLIASQYTLTRVLTNLTVGIGTSAASISAGTYTNLNLIRAGTQTLAGNIVVTGNLTIASGATLDQSTSLYTITVGGNWTNNGSGLVSRNALVVFNGTSQQIIGGSSSTTFNNVTDSNTTDTLFVNTNITIAASRTLTLAGANTVIQPAAAVVITGTTATITGTGTARVTRTAATANYISQYAFTTNTLTNLTVDYCANASQTVTIGGANYGNLSISGTGTKTLSAAITSTNVTGNITVKNGATLANGGFAIAGASGRRLTLDSNATLSLTGTSVFPTGFTIFTLDTHSTVNYAGAAQTVAARQYGNLTISGSSTKTPASGVHDILGNFTVSVGTYAANTNNPTLNIGGNFTNNATFTTGTGTTTFNGTTQTIAGSTTTFHALVISSSISTTLAVNTALQNVTGATLTISSGSVFDLATFTCNRAGVTGTNTFTINGTLQLSGASNFPTNFATPTYGASGTVNYYLASGGQTISGTTYQNLILSNTSGTQTAGGAITVNGTLTMSGGIFNMSTNALSGTLTTAGSGTIQTQNTTATPLPAGRTWSQDIVYNSSSAQTIVSGNYVNLTASGGNRTLQNSETIGVAGTFTAGSGTYTVTGSTVDFNGSGLQTIPAMSFNNLSVSGAKVGSPSLTLYPGTINIAGNFSNTSTGLGTIFTSGSKVDYNGATQNVAALTYGKLSISGTGLKTLTGNTTVNDSITVAGTSGLDGAGFTLTVLGPWINNAAYTGSSSTVVFAGYSGQTMSGTTVPTFNALTVNNSSGVSMSASATVGGLLSLSNGKLSVGSNTLTLNGAISSTANNCLTSNGSSNITIGSTGGDGTLFFDQTSVGTTNKLGTLTINRTGNTITLGNNLEVGTALNLTNGKLAIGSNTLTISGTISSTATNCLRANASSNLIVSGSGALGSSLFFDQSVAGTTNRIVNLTINRAGQTATLGNALQVTGIYTPTAGTLASAGNLTLVSNASGTAQIANGGCTSCSYVTGNVNIQRYVPSVARRYRFIGSTVQSTTLADWKNEIYITGTGGASNGFDATSSNAPSIYAYNESVITGDLNAGWVASTTITETLTPGKGYRVFVRGDRSNAARLTGSLMDQNEVTMDVVGVPNQGNVTAPVSFTSSGNASNDGWNLVSNPYAAPYDWNAQYDDSSTHTKIEPVIWVLSGQSGGYVSYNAWANAGNLTNGIIPAGASFWVKANAASPSLIFKEQYKITSSPVGVFKTREGENFNIRLFYDSITFDDVTVKYMDGASPVYDAYDIRKLAGTVTISAYGTDNVHLALSSRPLAAAVDTIKLNVSGAAGTYQLRFSNSDAISVADNVLLFDTYTSTVTDLKMVDRYSFNIISGVAASTGLNRFYIVIGNSSSLPVKLLQFTARKTGNKQVRLNWATAQETNSKSFIVERSEDGKQYSAIATQNAGGNTHTLINYTITDEQPARANYYRLKQVDLDGTYTYSAVQLVTMDEIAGAKLYPVPAAESLTIESEWDIEMISIYAISGAVVGTFKGEGLKTVIDVSALESGVYIIEYTDGAGNKTRDKFSKQ